MSTVPFPQPPSHPDHSGHGRPDLLGMSVNGHLASAVTELSALASHLARTAGVPAVMLVIDSELDTMVTTERTGDDSPIPIITIAEGVLYGELDSPTGHTAAGALAHALVCHEQKPTRLQQWLGRVAGLSAAALLIALVWGAALAVVISALTWVSAGLGVLALQRRSEYVADRAAQRLLDDAGLDGRACMLAMLYAIAAQEPQAYQRYGWIISGVPTAATRAYALTRATRATTSTSG
ncbi:hypothetical protein [Planobispora takensis]|uniref:Uncharacterized protein n=1 Tax=Planobispora takensis TaxID=1367882 RepID=A0A8J3X077_9ACTN|nr:hypothetical protein [Planobispora takensis]GII05467.1 hypothetical protein Pta02_74750 [Planobispora takensis]